MSNETHDAIMTEIQTYSEENGKDGRKDGEGRKKKE